MGHYERLRVRPIGHRRHPRLSDGREQMAAAAVGRYHVSDDVTAHLRVCVCVCVCAG